jgi:hypothetical protein
MLVHIELKVNPGKAAMSRLRRIGRKNWQRLLFACVGVALAASLTADLVLFLNRPPLADCARLGGLGWECYARDGYAAEGLPFTIDAGMFKAKADMTAAERRLSGAGLAAVKGEFLSSAAPALAGLATVVIALVQFAAWFLVFTLTVNLFIAVPVLVLAAWGFVLLMTRLFQEGAPEPPLAVDHQPYGDARAASITEVSHAAKGGGNALPPPMFKD